MEAVEDDDLLTRWDNLTRKSGLTPSIHDISYFLVVKKNRHLSMRHFQDFHPSQPYTGDIVYLTVSPTFAYSRRPI